MRENNTFKDKVLNYWGKNPELKEETIRYLLSINNFKSYEDWKNIVEVFLSIDSYFIEKHPDTIIQIIHKAQEEYENQEATNFIASYLSDESRLDIDFSNLFYALNQQHKKQNEDARKTFSKEVLNQICNRRLERFVTGVERNVEAAFNHFYSCWDLVDDENKIHITPRALELMRNYIEKMPEEYLKFSVRHMFVPIEPHLEYYHFVLEPFTKQIFKGWENFESFLKEINDKKLVAENVIDCFTKFYEIYKSRNYDSVAIQENELKNFRYCSNQIEDILNKV